MTQSQNGSGSSSFTRQTNYRVMLLRANGEIGLVCFCSDRRQAIKTASDVCKKYLKRLKLHWRQLNHRPDRPKLVFLEAWHGSPTYGFWEVPQRGGFRFEFHDRARDCQLLDDSSLQVKWKTGSLARCILLPKKTRKGGWRARIVESTFEGPVTNWQSIPANYAAGDEVALKICGISSRSGNAQFAVPSEGVSPE